MESKKIKNQSGFSLIEVIFAILLFAVFMYAATTVYMSDARTEENSAQAQMASERADEAVSQISQAAADLSAGGSFTVGENYEIALSDCTAATCDIVLEPAPATASLTSPAKGIPFVANYTVPAGSQIQFVRRWRVDDADAQYGLRKVTIAVLSDFTSTKPLILQEATVPISQR